MLSTLSDVFAPVAIKVSTSYANAEPVCLLWNPRTRNRKTRLGSFSVWAVYNVSSVSLYFFIYLFARFSESKKKYSWCLSFPLSFLLITDWEVLPFEISKRFRISRLGPRREKLQMK